MNNYCSFSEDRVYRYLLEHTWNTNLPTIAFCGLNPSVADERNLDPTLRRVKGYSQLWGYGGFVMLNLFAFRATLPRDMVAAADPIGPYNNSTILNCTNYCDKVIAMWGKDGKFRKRDETVIDLIGENKMYYLKLNQDSTPAHCLYLKKDLVPRPLSEIRMAKI